MGQDAAEASVCEPTPPPEAFAAALAGGDLSGALAAFDRMSPAEQAETQSNAPQQVQVPRNFELLSAIALLDAVWGDAAQTAMVIIEHGHALLLASVNVCDPIIEQLVRRLPDGLALMGPVFAGNPSQFATFLAAYAASVHEQLEVVGLMGGTPDWPLFMCVIDLMDRTDRQPALEEVRIQGLWDALLNALSEEHIAMVQGWLSADQGDGTDETLRQRMDAALNTSRANTALAALNGLNSLDTENRISARLRELLVMGVALPKLASSDIATEGWLSVTQVERAARALIYMPVKEYLRVSLLMELSGDEARLQQTFALLESVAARADSFGLVQQAFDGTDLEDVLGSGDLEELEAFADATRDMDATTLADQTSIVQTQVGGASGMVQKFTDSCGPTSAQVVRAEADPVEALRLNQTGQLDQNALDSDAAREQEASLERNYGQTAVARNRAGVVTAVTTALTSSTCSAAERLAVTNYINNVAFDQAKYDAALPKLRTAMGAAYPGDDALRMVREGAAGTGGSAGLTPGDLVTEANDQLNVDDVTGRTLVDNFDNTLWGLFNAASRQVNAVNMGAWSARVQALLNTAATLVDRGVDCMFIVYWNGSGGHFMTFTNVRTPTGAGREFLVHDPWTGTTQWVTQANILTGTFPGGQALLCGLQG